MQAFEETEKRKMEHANFAAWLGGVYMGYSMMSVFGENGQYPEKPLDLFAGEIDPVNQQEREEQLVAAYVTMFNKNFEA